jgi:hypothetical protein
MLADFLVCHAGVIAKTLAKNKEFWKINQKCLLVLTS